MMKKILFPIIFIITFLLANTTKVNAKPIDSRVAALVARNFMVNNTGKNYTIKDIVPEFYYDNSIVAFYVSFNEGGWVIVSANDLTVPILAYNEYGESNVNEKPDNSLDLLEGYYDCIKTVESYSIDNVYAKEEWERLLVLESKLSNKDNDKIQLLSTGNGRIAWGQSVNNDGDCENSYNLYFPSVSDNDNCECDRRYAGCGSVAMGQIMWYWKWPFVSKYRHYAWNDMPIKLYNDTPSKNAESVAHLLKDCADASSMNYLFCEGTWTTVNQINNAFDEYFGYNALKKYTKTDWNNDAWMDLIRSEIDAGRPVFYRADKSDLSGYKHFFVIDGYDKNNPDMFSINFGWNGSRDGFYNLNNILISYANYDIEYNANHKAIVGISPTRTSTYNISNVDYVNVNGNILEEAKNNIVLPQADKCLIVNEGATLIHSSGNMIVLQDGFHAKEGCYYEAFIDPELLDVKDIEVINIPNIITPNGDGINDELCIQVRNANSWEMIVYDRYGNIKDQSAGYFTGNFANIWDGGNLPDEHYYYYLRLKNNYGREYETSNNYVYVYGSTKTALNDRDSNSNIYVQIYDTVELEETSMYIDLINEDCKLNKSEIRISPNPFENYFTIDISNNVGGNELFVYNSMGILKYYDEDIYDKEDIFINGAEGLYFVVLKTNREIKTFKIIKQ